MQTHTNFQYCQQKKNKQTSNQTNQTKTKPKQTVKQTTNNKNQKPNKQTNKEKPQTNKKPLTFLPGDIWTLRCGIRTMKFFSHRTTCCHYIVEYAIRHQHHKTNTDVCSDKFILWFSTPKNSHSLLFFPLAFTREE